MKRLLILGLTALLYSSAFVQAGASFRAFPVSVFRAAGFSPRGFSLFDGPRRAADAAYENGKCSSVTGLAGTGVTADVMFSYSATDDHNAVITVAITNTPPLATQPERLSPPLPSTFPRPV